MRNFYSFILLLLFSISGLANGDTTLLLKNLDKIRTIMESNVDSAKPAILQSIKDCENAGFQKGIAKSYLQLTQYYYLKGLSDSSIALFPKMEAAAAKSENVNLRITVLLKVGLIYSDIGDFKHALEKIVAAQKLSEGCTDYRLVAKVYHDLGLLYSNKSIYPNAFKYWKTGLNYAKLSNDTFSIANLYARIGGAFNETNIPDSGLFYNRIALDYFEKIKMKRGIGVAYNNIAGSYELKRDYKNAVDYFMKALPIREELGDEYAMTIIYYNLGICNLHMKNYPLASKYLRMSLQRTKSEKDYQQVLETLRQLCELSIANNDLAGYRDYAKEYIELKDSITSADNIKAITELQEKYESEKREKDIITLKKENEKQEAIAASEKKNKLIVLLSSATIVLLMFIFGFILLKRYRVTQHQKRIIQSQKDLVEQQKSIVEEKQKEILDSISYAKRLQEAILPPSAFIRSHLPQSFVYYKPKDIVAGDFYWMEFLSKGQDSKGEQNDLVLLAAADCTGHGVPGAMVSVVCSNALNRAVKEFGITQPAKILDKVRELVIATFEKSESEVRDGMDISLCSIDLNRMQMEWSGANNPLWLIRDGQLTDHRPDKQPIGKMDSAEPFHNHVIPLKKGDSFYLFTDGYADQFGGPKGKKFKYKQLQDVLIENVSQAPEKQMAILDKTLLEWQGNLEQIDDILVIGFRV